MQRKIREEEGLDWIKWSLRKSGWGAVGEKKRKEKTPWTVGWSKAMFRIHSSFLSASDSRRVASVESLFPVKC